MEKYLTQDEIRYYPIGVKYKKATYGGRKYYIKQKVANNLNSKVVLEFFYRNGKWQISQNERQRAYDLGVEKKSIRRVVRDLNKQQKKTSVSLSLSKRQYQLLYTDYGDADWMGYYEKSSPEYIRVKDIFSNVEAGSRVYDVGCNSGGIGRLLIEHKKCLVFGSEICPALAEKAKRKGVEVFCGWAEKVPFENDYFDYLILTFILEHVLDPKVLLRESLRTLKEGGVILGHVPTEFGDWGKHTIGFHPEHLRAYSRKELEDLLGEYGLGDIFIQKEKLVGRRVADYYFFRAVK